MLTRVLKGLIMLLFGHRFIDNDPFYHIDSIDAIEHTPSNSTLFLEFHEDNLDIIKYLQKSQLPFVLEVDNITDLIYAENLGARYIILEAYLAKSAQKIAENYLFDAKILMRIHDEDEIEDAALAGVDGVLFAEAIIKITG